MSDLLTTMLQRLDESAAHYSTLDRYYTGDQPLSYLSPDARNALGDRLQRVTVNIPRLLVEAVAERLRVTGFSGVDVWPDWLASDLDQTAPILHREALTLGSAYAIVWAAADRPNVSVESAKQVVAKVDPATRQTVAALKRVEIPGKGVSAWLYLPDRVERWTSDQPGATTTGFRLAETLDNPLGVVPVVKFTNASRLLEEGRSEMSDVLDLTDAVVKTLTDAMVASEYTARPRRWATGVELEEEEILDPQGNPTGQTVAVNPIPEGSRAMVSENPDAKFGQLSGSDLAGYEALVGVLMRQISAVSGLPEHVLGIGSDSAMSADAIRSAESALTARAEARQGAFGRSWEQVARLIVAVRDRVDPATVHPRVKWADPSTKSVAQEADATVKLYAAGLLPATTALQRLGYDDEQIAEIRTARRAEALDGAGVDLTRFAQ